MPTLSAKVNTPTEQNDAANSAIMNSVFIDLSVDLYVIW